MRYFSAVDRQIFLPSPRPDSTTTWTAATISICVLYKQLCMTVYYRSPTISQIDEEWRSFVRADQQRWRKPFFHLAFHWTKVLRHHSVDLILASLDSDHYESLKIQPLSIRKLSDEVDGRGERLDDSDLDEEDSFDVESLIHPNGNNNNSASHLRYTSL